MTIFIVYAHPSRKSYTFQILQHLIALLEDKNHRVVVSDLYEMNFLSDMSESEYDREGLRNFEIEVSADVREEHLKIEQADAMVFLYPVWWSDCPAKLKGWFDRVYSVGFAYGHNAEQNARRMRVIKSGMVICTAGYANDYLNELGIAQSMAKVMLNDRLGERFVNKEMFILGGTLKIDAVRQLHLAKVAEIVHQIIQN